MRVRRAYQRIKNIYHWLQAHWWRAYYGWPDRALKLYGVTGTNGKTTTSIILGAILREVYGREKVGLVTTEVFWFGEQEEKNATHMTSIDARLVFGYLRRMVDQGVQQVVLEMTSHALDQHRLAGVKLEGAIILNIKHEHLDYHKTMNEYAAAKMKIINYIRSDGVLVGKGDDEWIRQEWHEMTTNELRVIEFSSEQARSVVAPLPGDFNQENVLAATLLARELGLNEEKIRAAVEGVEQVPGRMEWVKVDGQAIANSGQLPRVMIDFALTPYAYERLFAYLRRETKGKLWAVFGAAGRRDKEKRPIITKIVSQYADEIILTQDEPYDDSEEEIYQQLEAGLKDSVVAWRRIEDRREAIKYAIQKSGIRDVVVITGMGNFDTRMVGDKALPWNDKKVVLEIIREMEKKR